jgi:hypothetical protein
MENTITRKVYDFPVAAHRCQDDAVHYVKLVRRNGEAHPQGVCPSCHVLFQYEKPQRSSVKHASGEGATHF